MIHFINKLLPRIDIAGVDIALWLDCGWIKCWGYGVQWKHERYLTPNPLRPIHRVRVGPMLVSAIKGGSAYRAESV